MRSTTAKTYTILKGSIIRESDKAVRFHVDMPGDILHDETFWFPISQMKRKMIGHGNNLDEIEVADWLVTQKQQDVANISSKANANAGEERLEDGDATDEYPWQS